MFLGGCSWPQHLVTSHDKAQSAEIDYWNDRMPELFSPRRLEGWQDAEDRICEIVNGICDGRSTRERAEISVELVSIVTKVADGHCHDDLKENFEAREVQAFRSAQSSLARQRRLGGMGSQLALYCHLRRSPLASIQLGERTRGFGSAPFS